MSEDSRLAIVRTSAFSESMKGTIGAGVGLALIVGIPTVIVGGVALYIGIRIWRTLKEWSRSVSADQVDAKIENTSVGEVEVRLIEEKPLRKKTRQRKMSRSIVR